MSTVPPPYQFDPKAQRRAAAAQARASRDSYKAQRDLIRQQTRQLRRGSILGPLLLVAFGLIALLLSTGRWSALSFVDVYARWWPVLLVLAGLVLVAEWAYDHYLVQSRVQNGLQPGFPIRRRVGGGVVFLLILLAVFGATSRTVHGNPELLNNAFSFNSDNLAEVFGDQHDLPAEVLDQTLPPLTPGLTLTIDNPRGDINITGKSNDGNLHITVNKHLFSSSSLATRGPQLTPEFVATANGLSLTVPTVEAGSADLTILVPESLALSIAAHRGDTKITGIKAPVTINSNRGDIELQSIAGNVDAHLDRSRDSFIARNITGDLSLRGHVADVNIDNVTGRTSLEVGYYGDVHLEHLLGPVAVENNKTHFTLARVDGHVYINKGNISGSEIVGPVDLRVSSRNISFDKLSGDLDLTNSNGPVDITTIHPGNLSIVNTNGAIDVTIPDRTGLTLSADTNGSSIDNDFNLSPVKTGDHTALAGTLGDGKNRVSLQTTHANIVLHKSPATPPSSAKR